MHTHAVAMWHKMCQKSNTAAVDLRGFPTDINAYTTHVNEPPLLVWSLRYVCEIVVYFIIRSRCWFVFFFSSFWASFIIMPRSWVGTTICRSRESIAHVRMIWSEGVNALPFQFTYHSKKKKTNKQTISIFVKYHNTNFCQCKVEISAIDNKRDRKRDGVIFMRTKWKKDGFSISQRAQKKHNTTETNNLLFWVVQSTRSPRPFTNHGRTLNTFHYYWIHREMKFKKK